MKKLIVTAAICAVLPLGAFAQLAISSLNTTQTIDFSTTRAGVNNGTFNGAGFQASPSAGQLDSDAWAATGFSDGALAFGGTRTTANTDYTRGATFAATGGIYGLTVSSNTFLAIRSGGSDFTGVGGSITLQITNTTGSTVSSWNIAYDILSLNDQARSNSLNFSWATGAANTPGSFTSQPTLDFATTATASGSPAWQATARSITLSATVPAGSSLFLRWTGGEVSGSGSRDGLGLDNISLTAIPEPSTYAAIFGALALAGVVVHRRRQARR